MIRKFLIGLSTLLAASIVLFGIYGVIGWYDAINDTETLQRRADAIIAGNRGGDSLPPDRLNILLLVQDPGFYAHSGVDLHTPGAGLTTLTQSISKRLAFDSFTPGIGKIRQTGYALGLDSRLTKEQQIALFLETAEMGQSRQGWITGFHNASEHFFGAPPQEISEENFLTLVAVLIAPGTLKLAEPSDRLRERVRRIARLSRGECKASALNDVWLEGCG
ncbi:MAG: transglycosylase domain-containing protein [Stappiaceae bacterium]